MRRVLNTSARQTVFLWALFGFPIGLAIYALARGEVVPALGAVLYSALIFPGAVIESVRRRRGWSQYHARRLEARLMTAGVAGLVLTGVVLLIGPFDSSRGARGAGVVLLISAVGIGYVVVGARRRVNDLGRAENQEA